MIAIQSSDKCFSTALNGHNPFNTDHKERTTLSVEEAATALDFDIVKNPCYDEGGRKVPGVYHLRRTDTDGFIHGGGVGDKFVPVQHRDVFKYITEKVMPKVPEMKLEMCGTIQGGAVGLIAAKFGDTFTIPGDTSEQNLRLFFANPCNGRGSLTVGFTHVRVICQNTLVAATREAKGDGWTIRHTQGANVRVDAALNQIHAQAAAALEMKARAEELARIGVDSATVAACLDRVFPLFGLPENCIQRTRLVQMRDTVMEQFEGGATAQTMKADTAWKLFNAFSYPVFNPVEAGRRISSKTDKAQIAFKGMTGGTGRAVRELFETVESVVRAA